MKPWKVVLNHNDGSIWNSDFRAHYVEYGLLWVTFYKRKYSLFGRDIVVARVRRSKVVAVFQED